MSRKVLTSSVLALLGACAHPIGEPPADAEPARYSPPKSSAGAAGRGGAGGAGPSGGKAAGSSGSAGKSGTAGRPATPGAGGAGEGGADVDSESGGEPGTTHPDPTTTPGELSLHYRAGNVSTLDNQIGPHLRIVSSALAPLELSALSVRYYLTSEPAPPLTVELYTAAAEGTSGYRALPTGSVAVAVEADFVELTFTSAAGLLDAGGQVSIEIAVHDTGWNGLFDESNDYSFNPAHATYAAWDHVTLYDASSLVWGNRAAVKLLDLVAGPTYAMSDLTHGDVPHTAEDDMLGVQISPGRVRAAVVEAGAIVRRHDQALAPGIRPDEVMEAVVTSAQSLHASPTAIGLAIPGEVDSSGRCWGLSGVQGFDGVYIAEEVAARLGCPVSIESDGNAAALAERTHGRGKGHPSALTVLLGDRLAAGLTLGGELRRGSSGFGISLSHLRIDSSPEAAACSCGRRGCLGAVAGVVAESDAGSLQRLGSALGTGVALIQNILDLDAVVLVCPKRETFRAIEPLLRASLRELVFGAPASELPLFESLLGTDAVLIGAATLAATIGAPPASR